MKAAGISQDIGLATVAVWTMTIAGIMTADAGTGIATAMTTIAGTTIATSGDAHHAVKSCDTSLPPAACPTLKFV